MRKTALKQVKLMKKRKIPLRMCLGCKGMFPKRELIRVVKNNENEINIDFTSKMNGRGAYICPKSSCFETAKKSGQFERAFQMRISGEIYNELAEKLEEFDE